MVLLAGASFRSEAQPYKLFGGERQDQAFDIKVVDDKVVVIGDGLTSGPITITGFKLVTTKNLELISFAYYPDTTARESFFSFDNRQDTLFIAGSKPNLCCDSIYDNDAMLSIEVNGTIIDKRLFGGMYGDQFSALSILDNYLYLFGSTYSHTTEPQGPNGCDPYVVKCNLQGNLIWEKHPGTTAFDIFSDATPDAVKQSFLCVGGSAPTTSGDPYYNGLIIKMDTAGGTPWRKTLKTGALRFELFTSVIATPDGGGVAAGYVFDPLEEVGGPWLVRFDANGDTIWTRLLYRFSEAEYSPYNKRWLMSEVWDVQQLATGDFVFTGSWYNSDSSTRDIFICKYSASGDSLWRIDLGNEWPDKGYAITEDEDGFIYVAGSLAGTTAVNGLQDVLLIKLDANGCTVDTCLVTAIHQTVAVHPDVISVYPNPGNGTFVLSISNPDLVQLNVYNTIGQPVWTGTSRNGEQIKLNQPAGLYLVEAIQNGRTERIRLVIQ